MNIIKVAYDYWDEEFIPDGIKLWQISMHDHFLNREEIDRMISFPEIIDDPSRRFYYFDYESKFLKFFDNLYDENKIVFITSKKKLLGKKIKVTSKKEFLKKCKNGLRELIRNEAIWLFERNILFIIHFDLSVLFFYPEKENISDLVDLAKKNGLFCLDYESLKQEN